MALGPEIPPREGTPAIPFDVTEAVVKPIFGAVDGQPAAHRVGHAVYAVTAFHSRHKPERPHDVIAQRGQRAEPHMPFDLQQRRVQVDSDLPAAEYIAPDADVRPAGPAHKILCGKRQTERSTFGDDLK